MPDVKLSWKLFRIVGETMVDNSTKEFDTIDSIWAVTLAGEKRRISYTLKYLRNKFNSLNFIILNFSKLNLENLEISI